MESNARGYKNLKKSFKFSHNIEVGEFSKAIYRMTAEFSEVIRKIKIPSISEKKKARTS